VFFAQKMAIELPNACSLDITPPTFAGIVAATPQANGSLLASWGAGSDLTLPINYEVYCLPGASVPAATLFAAVPAIKTSNLSEYLFRDRLGALLTAQAYTLGVRARDGVGNLNSNLVTINATATGVLTDSLATIAASLASTQAALATNVSDLDAIETALAADAASIDASATSLAASASTLSNALAGLPQEEVAIGVIEQEEVIGLADGEDELILALSSGGVGVSGDEVTIYPTITAPQALAKSLTLPFTPADSTEVKVDWISVGPQAYGVDFTVSGLTLSWAGLGMDTEGLAAGDKLRIFYLKQ